MLNINIHVGYYDLLTQRKWSFIWHVMENSNLLAIRDYNECTWYLLIQYQAMVYVQLCILLRLQKCIREVIEMTQTRKKVIITEPNIAK